ncbi:hypothetical protein MMC07_006512 [Pseudocyphellaria aurata]|nr:hypothetical protein [Pseudocyphellaria aurata]
MQLTENSADIRDAVIPLAVQRYTYTVLSILSFIAIYNISVACYPLMMKKDNLTDIDLTPSQRALLGLDPNAAPPATPATQYITPPRYPRSSTPRNDSPGSMSGSNADSSLSTQGSPSLGRQGSESPFSPSPLPMWQKAIGGSRSMGRSHSYGSLSPLGFGRSGKEFWELPASTEDVFSLFSPVDVRRARDSSLKNLETLISALTARLSALRHNPSFPDIELAPEKHVLNCIRVLTRILPFLYEVEHLEAWEDNLFWAPRKKRSKHEQMKTEVLFDESRPKEVPEPETKESFEIVKPLGEELIDNLIDLLFYTEFTLPPNERSRKKVTYSIWQSGVGCNTPISSSKELESNRTEILRLLLTLSSKSLYMPALSASSNKAQTLKYNPASWRVPYDHVVYRDPKQVLVSYCLQFLLILLLYPIPEGIRGPPPKNYFRHFLGRLHHPRDFQFLVDGMMRTLNQPLQATSSYLPGSQKSLKWAPEMIMLFWETLQCNKRFRSFIIDTERGHDFVILVLFYALEYKTDPARQGVSIHALITTSKGKLDAIYPALLATVNNVAAYLENIGPQSSSKLLHLFTLMSAPGFLFANESNHLLLQSLLESMNAILEHQYSSNRDFVNAIHKSKKRFEALRSFTLESGQEEIERLNQRKKDMAEVSGQASSPPRPSRNSSIESPRSPQSVRTPILSNVPEEDGTFAVGDDEDSDNDEDRDLLPTPSHSSPSAHNSRTPSVASSAEEPLPTQLRGMSEKARGKMPAGQPSFSRQNSTTSLSSHPAVMAPSTSSFNPSAQWIDSWLPSLPLHTILTLISTAPSPKLPATIDPSPPRIHLFEWTPLSLGWYESLLWGLIFASEMVVQKGTVGVWNGTSVRLFRVEKEATRGPSLMKPMGAVDAVGSNLVMRIGGLNRRSEGDGRVGGARENQ